MLQGKQDVLQWIVAFRGDSGRHAQGALVCRPDAGDRLDGRWPLNRRQGQVQVIEKKGIADGAHGFSLGC
jgi:hypothetical protein